MNAYTSFDRTVFHIDVPNTGAKVALDILCDIMQNATLPPDELAKEKQVILREMDMNTDDPGRRAGRRLFETAYTRSPYRFTVIGYPDIFNELKPEDIRGYYHEKYAPNNVFYVVAGDVKPDEVVAQIRDGLREDQSPAAAARRAARGTEADRPARSHRGSAHRTGPLPLRLAHPRTAPSGRAGPRRAGRAARAWPQLAPLPGGAREDRASSTPSMPGPTAPAARLVRHERHGGPGQVPRRARRHAGRSREDEGGAGRRPTS